MIVIRQPVASWICSYFWAGVIASLALFLYEKPQPSLIELSFYPLILVEGTVIWWFLNHKLNSSLENLRMDHVLPEEVFGVFLARVERRLNNMGATSFGIIVGLGVVVYYCFDANRRHFALSQAYILMSIIDIMLGYGLGVGAWKAMVLGWEFSNLGFHPKLQIRWSHPDKCAGLSGVGELFLSLSLTLLPIGLFCAAWIVWGWWNPSKADAAVHGFAPWLQLWLIATIAVSGAAFVLPMLRIHFRMKSEAVQLRHTLSRIADEILDCEKELLSGDAPLDAERLARTETKMRALRAAYAQRSEIPTWPVDFPDFRTFLLVQIPLWLAVPKSFIDVCEKLTHVVGKQ